MRRYEVTYVMAPTVTPEEVEKSIEAYKSAAEEKGATVVKIDNWGKRRLAFPVKKHAEGYYVILTLDEERAEASTELERRFKVSDPIIRFLTVRIDEDLQRADKFKAAREAKKLRRKEASAKAATPPVEAVPQSEEEPAAKPPKSAGKAEEKAAKPKKSAAAKAKAEKKAAPKKKSDEAAADSEEEADSAGDDSGEEE